MEQQIKFLTRKERLEIVLNIAKKLKKFTLQNNTTIDLYQEHYSFIPELKEIFNNYVKQDDLLPLDFSGIIRFEEINKDIEYNLPVTNKKEPLFVIRMQK
jgi:hypothetical protein